MKELNRFVNGIAPATSKLASVFSTTAVDVRENFEEYIIKLAWFDMWVNMTVAFTVLCLLTSVVMIITYVSYDVDVYIPSSDKYYKEIQEEKYLQRKKLVVRAGLIGIVVAVVVPFLVFTVPYIASSEIYGLKLLLRIME